MASWFDKVFRRKAPAQARTGSPVSVFWLQTSQGEIVYLPDGVTQPRRAASPAPSSRLLALIPDLRPELCLLVAPDGQLFAMPRDDMAGVAIAARVLRTNAREVVRLKQPLGGLRFLTADDAAPDLRYDGPGTSMEAAFTLLPVPAFEVAAAPFALAQAFGVLVAAGFRLATMLDALSPELAGAALSLLPRDELDDLARLALNDPGIRRRLQDLLPGDAFLHERLPALVAWQRARTATATDGALDFPASDETLILPCVDRRGASLGLALHTLARGHVLPRRGFCLLAAARNEGPYLLDWLAYHLSIGFEHVFLYTNDNTDGSDTLLGHLARHGIITWVRNPRGATIGVQEKAYAHALTLLPDILDYRWTAVLDLDEYFCVDPGMFGGVADFMALHEAQPVDAVALCWLIFAARIGDAYADAPISQRLAWRANDVNTHVKSIFRTRLFWHSQPHYPYPTLAGPFIYRSQDGGFHHHPGVQDRIPAFSANPAAEQGWVNHYLLRTAPEALSKLARGSAAWAHGDDERERPVFADFIARTFLDLAKPEKQVADRRIDARAKGQAATLERLLALPGVAESNEAIKRDFAQNLKTLSERFLAAPLPEDATPAQRQFRDAVAASLGLRRSAPPVAPPRSRMI